MKRKTLCAATAGFLIFLCVIPARAQSTAAPISPFDAPNARLGLLWGVPTGVKEYTSEINGHIARGETDKAAARVREALIETQNHPELLVLAGHVFTIKRQFFLAEDAWAQLAAQFPSNAWAQACWGGMLLRVERWTQADDVLSAARQMDPTELVARYNLACSRLHAGSQLPLWMLNDLTAEEVGRIATWIGDEPDVLIPMLTEDGYRTLCRAVLTGQTGVGLKHEDVEIEALNGQMKDVARALWEAYQAKQKRDWKGAIRALQQAQAAGAVTPAVEKDFAACRAHISP